MRSPSTGIGVTRPVAARGLSRSRSSRQVAPAVRATANEDSIDPGLWVTVEGGHSGEFAVKGVGDTESVGGVGEQ